MYTNYFGLKEQPFSLTPDPRFLYMSALHREALAHLLYGVSSDGCFILLTGDMGTGKTTVARCLLSRIPEDTDVALIDNPRLTALELLESICHKFAIDLGGVETNQDALVEKISHFLLDAHGRGRNIALLIDEAQNLSLDLLRLLINLEDDHKNILKIILLGQTELTQILNQEGAAEINQRITSRYHLLPLDRENCFLYIQHRLAVAGERETVFSQKALAHVFELSSGVPRLINVLCDRALLGTYEEEKYLVSASIVDAAAEDVLGSTDDEKLASLRKPLWQKLLLTVVLAICATGAALYYVTGRNPVVSLPPAHVEKVKVKKAVPEPIVKEEKAEQKEEQKRASIRIIPLEVEE